MTNNSDTKDQKRISKKKISDIKAKRSKVSFDVKDDHDCDIMDDYDQNEVDKVLDEQEFPMQKMSSKYKNLQ